MKTKKIYSEKLKGIVEDCRECHDRQDMTSTGNLIFDAATESWFIEFVCQKCGEVIPLWHRDYKELIEEIVNSAK